MKRLTDTDLFSAPKYRQIADRLREEIRTGKFKQGEKMPNEHVLSGLFKVSRNTVRDAVAMLINEGLVRRRHGFGTYVEERLQAKTKRAVFLMNQVGNPFASHFSNDVYKGVTKRMGTSRAWELDVKILNEPHDDPDAFAEELASTGVDGGIFLGRFDSELIQAISRKLFLVLVGKTLEGFAGPVVTPNARSAMTKAFDHLLSLGHKRIAYLPSFLHHAGYREKLDAFLSLSRQYGDRLEDSDEPIYALGEYSVAVREVMIKRPTAVIACTDNAVTALNELKGMGLRVPEDVSFMALDDLGRAEFSDPPMTVIDIDNEEIGGQAFDLVAKGDDERVSAPQRLFVSERLIERESTGEAR